MVAGIINFILGLLGVKRAKINENNNMRRSVQCPNCGWHGTVSQSLEQDTSNDRCPVCGESKLSYLL